MPSSYNFFQRYPEKMTFFREIWTKGGKISTINEKPVPEKIMQNKTFRRLLDSVKLINFIVIIKTVFYTKGPHHKWCGRFWCYTLCRNRNQNKYDLYIFSDIYWVIFSKYILQSLYRSDDFGFRKWYFQFRLYENLWNRSTFLTKKYLLHV